MGGLRTYHSFVGGQDISSGSWVYVVSGGALLTDAFASLSLKRRLERGQAPGADLPPAIVGRVGRADTAIVRAALRAAADAAPEWGATPADIRITGLGKRIHETLLRHADEIVDVLVQEGHPVRLARWQVSGMLECFGPQSLGCGPSLGIAQQLADRLMDLLGVGDERWRLLAERAECRSCPKWV